MSNNPQYQPPAPHQNQPPSSYRKLIVALAALVAVLLVVLIVVAVSSSSDGPASDDASSDGTVDGSSAPANQNAACVVRDNKYLDRAKWTDKQTNDGESQPSGVLMLVGQTQLPEEFASLADDDANWFITQFQDKNVGVYIDKEFAWRGGTAIGKELTTVDPDGVVVGTSEFIDSSEMPRSFDLVKPKKTGYYRIEAADKIQVPAEAAGNNVNMEYAQALMPDAFDPEKFWIALRGSSTLYSAKLYQSESEWRELGDSFGDTTQCGYP